MTASSPKNTSLSPPSPHGSSFITIDFETRSECNLKKCGAWVYSKHPSTEVLCMAYKIDDGPTRLWKRGDLFPLKLRKALEDGAIVEAHNAFFEYCHWNNKQTSWPSLDWSRFRCSAAKAARYGLPRKLETLCQVMDLGIKKDMAGNRLMLKMCKPRKPTKNNRAKWHETEEDLARLYEYCVKDVDAEHAVSKALPELSAEELRVWQLTERINTHGLYSNVEFARKAIEVLDHSKSVADARLQEITGGAVRSCRQVAVLMRWLQGQGIQISDMTKAGVEKSLDGLEPGPAREALELRQVFSRASVSKYEAMINRADPEDNRVRDLLRYYGAITGRWAGQGLQVQNLKSLRGQEMSDIDDIVTALDSGVTSFLERFPDPTGPLSLCVRPTLSAEPGKILTCADYRQIEARVLMWLCWNENMLQALREGRNIYCEMGAQIFGREITKEGDPLEYKIAKAAVLGLGYGLGAKRFAEETGVEPDLAERVVNTFREGIIGPFWKDLEQAFIACIAGDGRKFSHGVLTFRKEYPFVYVGLPSGREIAYFKPEIRMEETPWGSMRPKIYYWTESSINRKWTQVSTWGGKLCENVDQAIARDVIASASLRIADRGDLGDIVLSVHDELVVEGEWPCLEELIDEMCRPLAWAPGLPLEAEGWVGRRFR
jgi:DNA polymerase